MEASMNGAAGVGYVDASLAYQRTVDGNAFVHDHVSNG